jgi:hypothetical protein
MLRPLIIVYSVAVAAPLLAAAAAAELASLVLRLMAKVSK